MSLQWTLVSVVKLPVASAMYTPLNTAHLQLSTTLLIEVQFMHGWNFNKPMHVHVGDLVLMIAWER